MSNVIITEEDILSLRDDSFITNSLIEFYTFVVNKYNDIDKDQNIFIFPTHVYTNFITKNNNFYLEEGYNRSYLTDSTIELDKKFINGLVNDKHSRSNSLIENITKLKLSKKEVAILKKSKHILIPCFVHTDHFVLANVSIKGSEFIQITILDSNKDDKAMDNQDNLCMFLVVKYFIIRLFTHIDRVLPSHDKIIYKHFYAGRQERDSNDCGIWVMYYIDTIVKNRHQIIQSGKTYGMDWFNTPGLAVNIRKIYKEKILKYILDDTNRIYFPDLVEFIEGIDAAGPFYDIFEDYVVDFILNNQAKFGHVIDSIRKLDGFGDIIQKYDILHPNFVAKPKVPKVPFQYPSPSPSPPKVPEVPFQYPSPILTPSPPITISPSPSPPIIIPPSPSPPPPPPQPQLVPPLPPPPLPIPQPPQLPIPQPPPLPLPNVPPPNIVQPIPVMSRIHTRVSNKLDNDAKNNIIDSILNKLKIELLNLNDDDLIKIDNKGYNIRRVRNIVNKNNINRRNVKLDNIKINQAINRTNPIITSNDTHLEQYINENSTITDAIDNTIVFETKVENLIDKYTKITEPGKMTFYKDLTKEDKNDRDIMIKDQGGHYMCRKCFKFYNVDNFMHKCDDCGRGLCEVCNFCKKAQSTANISRHIQKYCTGALLVVVFESGWYGQRYPTSSRLKDSFCKHGSKTYCSIQSHQCPKIINISEFAEWYMTPDEYAASKADKDRKAAQRLYNKQNNIKGRRIPASKLKTLVKPYSVFKGDDIIHNKDNQRNKNKSSDKTIVRKPRNVIDIAILSAHAGHEGVSDNKFGEGLQPFMRFEPDSKLMLLDALEYFLPRVNLGVIFDGCHTMFDPNDFQPMMNDININPHDKFVAGYVNDYGFTKGAFALDFFIKGVLVNGSTHGLAPQALSSKIYVVKKSDTYDLNNRMDMSNIHAPRFVETETDAEFAARKAQIKANKPKRKKTAKSITMSRKKTIKETKLGIIKYKEIPEDPTPEFPQFDIDKKVDISHLGFSSDSDNGDGNKKKGKKDKKDKKKKK